MTVRYLPLILILGALALAPIEAAAQEIYAGPGQRTDGTPSDREAANGVFKPRKPAVPGQTPSVELGEVQATPRIEGVRPEDVAARYVTQAVPYTTDPPPPNTQTRASPPAADREPRPKTQGAPVNSSSENKPLPPGADPRQVRPAEAFPPERIEKAPQAPSRAGVDAQTIPPKDDPRSLEERKDPGG
jgi:hypothetical protein